MHSLSDRIDPTFEVILQGRSHDMRMAVGEDGFPVAKLPFSVGRRLGQNERPVGRPVDLALTDRRPFLLSRCHFAIIRHQRGLAILDTGSRQGTIVNGTAIGRKSGVMRVELEIGENSVIAGNTGSPYRFIVTLRAANSSLRKRSSA